MNTAESSAVDRFGLYDALYRIDCDDCDPRLAAIARVECFIDGPICLTTESLDTLFAMRVGGSALELETDGGAMISVRRLSDHAREIGFNPLD